MSLEFDELYRLPIADGLVEAISEEILSAAQTRLIRKGSIISAEGDPASAVHILTSGYAKMIQTTPNGGRVLLRFFGPGEMFGLSAFKADGLHPADVVAVTDVAELQWPARNVREMVVRHPDFALNVIRVLETWLRIAERLLGELSNEPVEQRIAQTLVRLTGALGRPAGDLIEVPFPITRQDVADMTGSTLHTVSRVYKAWEEQGLVRIGRQRVAVADVSRLKALAEGKKAREASPRRTHRKRAGVL